MYRFQVFLKIRHAAALEYFSFEYGLIHFDFFVQAFFLAFLIFTSSESEFAFAYLRFIVATIFI